MHNLTFEKKAFYSPSEIAEILDVHPTTVRGWISEGKLYGIKLSERVTRVPFGGLMDLLGEPLPATVGVLTPEETELYAEGRHSPTASATAPGQ